MKKWGYGLIIFGILGFIATMTNKETMNIQNFLITLFFIFLGMFLIIKSNRNNIHNNMNIKEKVNNISYKTINDLGSNEGIIYPIHIKYKKIEVKNYQDENLNFWRDMWYNPTVASQNQLVYNCILDNKIVATLSCGQEADIDVASGEHIIYFEPVNNLPRNKIKNK